MDDPSRNDEFAHIMLRIVEMAGRLSDNDPEAKAINSSLSLKTEDELEGISWSLSISLGVNPDEIDLF